MFSRISLARTGSGRYVFLATVAVAIAAASSIVMLSRDADARRQSQALLSRLETDVLRSAMAQAEGRARSDRTLPADEQRAIDEADSVTDRRMRALLAETAQTGALSASLQDVARYLRAYRSASGHGIVVAPPGTETAAALGDEAAHEASGLRLHAAIAHATALLDVAASRENTFADGGAVVLVTVALGLVALVTRRAASAERRSVVSAAEQRILSEQESRFRALVQHSSDLVLVVDDGQTVRYASAASEHMLGITPSALIGRPLADVLRPADTATMFRAADRGYVDRSTTMGQCLHANGTWIAVEMVQSDLRGMPTVGGIVLNLRDVSERAELQERLAHLALHDALTGLANRVLFQERVQRRLQAEGDERPQPEDHARRGTAVVLFLDLDDFKTVNDSLGHAAGDALLRTVAARLLSATSAGDTVARLGGDEFAVLLGNVMHPAEADQVVQRILDALAIPVEVSATTVRIGASIGICAADAAISPDDLLRNADAAMYVAKRSSKGTAQWFAAGMHTTALERLHLEADLRHAIERNEFRLVYQPIIDLQRRLVSGVEALVRWQHPTRGLLAPSAFIGLAESTGLIVPLGRRVLVEACQQAVRWQIETETPLTISVNVSAIQLRAGARFVDDVAMALDMSGLEPECLQLEITESVMMNDARETTETLLSLRALGVKLALDDFGTGYSSLSYLERLPLDVLKIDKAFVDRLARDGGGASPLAEVIVSIGETLGLRVVGEGVEVAAQDERLRNLGCTYGQGYFYARPLLPADVIAFIENWEHHDPAASDSEMALSLVGSGT